MAPSAVARQWRRRAKLAKAPLSPHRLGQAASSVVPVCPPWSTVGCTVVAQCRFVTQGIQEKDKARSMDP